MYLRTLLGPSGIYRLGMGRGGLRVKRILKYNHQFYNLQEKFRKRKVSAGFQKKIQDFGIKKKVLDMALAHLGKGLRKKKQPKEVLALQTSPAGGHKVEGKAGSVGLNNSSAEGSFSTFILGSKSLITSSATNRTWEGAQGV